MKEGEDATRGGSSAEAGRSEIARAAPGPRTSTLVAELVNLDALARLPEPAYPLASVYVLEEGEQARSVRRRQLALPMPWNHELEELLLKLLTWTTAANTVAAYRPAIQQFWHFCAERSLDRYELASLRDFVYLVSYPRLVYLQAIAKGAPAEPARAQPGVGRATVQSIIAAVSATFGARNLPLPSDSSAWGLWLRGLMRRLRQPKDKKDAILAEDLLRTVRLAREHKNRHIGLRDAALLLLGWSAALRRSEIASVQVDHVRQDGRNAGGWHLWIPASKTDQLGSGYEVPLYAAEKLGAETDVLVAWHAWLEAALLVSGPAFRAFSGQGVMTEHGMSERAIAALCESYAEGNISGHSLRAGWVTQAVIDGRGNYERRQSPDRCVPPCHQVCQGRRHTLSR